jgi:hypothetical protein
VKPWVAVASIFVAYKAPQLVARQAMMAGLAPPVGSWAGRALIYGGAANRLAVARGGVAAGGGSGGSAAAGGDAALGASSGSSAAAGIAAAG